MLSVNGVASSLSLLLALSCGCILFASVQGAPPTSNIRPILIGGAKSFEKQFPYLVALIWDGRYKCGGSLISETMILSAAHCTFGREAGQTRAIVGTNNLGAGNGKWVKVAELINHPQYRRDSHEYDISLIRLQRPLQFSDAVQKIPLADPEDNYPADTMATVSGFGAINKELKYEGHLKFASVPIWSSANCNNEKFPKLTEGMFCAGHPSGQIGSCQGDSGGPLTVDGKLYGVVSWGFGCGKENLPSFYTHVPTYRSWIDQNAKT